MFGATFALFATLSVVVVRFAIANRTIIAAGFSAPFARPFGPVAATTPAAAAAAALAAVVVAFIVTVTATIAGIAAIFAAIIGFDLVVVLDHLIVVIFFDGEQFKLGGELRTRPR